MVDETFTPQVHNEGEPGNERFEIWVRGMCVHRSDHEAFVNVYIDGARVFSLEAEIEYEDPATKKFGERPEPIGFKVRAQAADVKGQNLKGLGTRKWRIRKDVEE